MCTVCDDQSAVYSKVLMKEVKLHNEYVWKWTELRYCRECFEEYGGDPQWLEEPFLSNDPHPPSQDPQ